MTYISTNEDGLVAVSLSNRLEVFNPSSTTHILSHTNSIEKQDSDSNDPDFVRHAHANNKTFFAAITGDKKLLIWNTADGNAPTPLTYILPKRPTCLCFCNQDQAVLVGDKTGDVYRCEYGIKDRPVPQLMLGHLSMVLDVAISRDDSFVISADRDEKIRVSHYPNSYNTLNYCFGHTQLVSTIALTSRDILVSGSGDGTLRWWEYREGREMGSLGTSAIHPALKVVSKIAYHDNTISVIGENCPAVVFLTFSSDMTAITCDYIHHLETQPRDICFRSGRLLVLQDDREHPVLCVRKEQGEYVESNVAVHALAPFEGAWVFPRFQKMYTELLKVDALKRLDVEITPESTIDNVVAMDEKPEAI